MPVRDLLPSPKQGQLPFLEKPSPIELKHSEYVPNLEEFGFNKDELTQLKDSRASLNFVGGEEAGLNRV